MRRTLLIAAVLLLAVAAPARAGLYDTTLVSTASGLFEPVGGDDGALDPAASRSGRFIAFRSEADNLSTQNDDAFYGVYVRDTVAGTTEFVSRATGAAGAGANGFVYDPSISANGRFVAFQSEADNLSPDDDNAVSNIYLRDLALNTTTLVSRAHDDSPGHDDSRNPSISDDGTRVAFDSGDQLTPDDAAAHGDVFVRDLRAGTTTLVSRASGIAGAGGNNLSSQPDLSGDGKHVAFQSTATNLTSDSLNGQQHVFVRDLDAATNELASRASGPTGAIPDGSSSWPSLSEDGSRVAFDTYAENISTEDLDDSTTDVFVRDLNTDTTILASRATGPNGAPGDRGSNLSSISADGRRVAIDSDADTVSTEDADSRSDVFVRDLDLQTTTFVSRASGATGAPGDDGSSSPSIAGDGRIVAFAPCSRPPPARQVRAAWPVRPGPRDPPAR